MGFIIDKQTLDDLGIFGKKGTDSIYGIFNNTCTKGGAALLEEWFLYPLDRAARINKRAEAILFFQHKQLEFPFRGETLDAAEYYLSQNDRRSRLESEDRCLNRKIHNYIRADTQYKAIHRGVCACREILQILKELLKHLEDSSGKYPLFPEAGPFGEMLRREEFHRIITEKENLTYCDVATCDEVLRFQQKELFCGILSFVYLLDVYIAVAKVADERGFKLGKALDEGTDALEMIGLYHPLLQHPIANDVRINSRKNVVFLTGVNMAGKSTFMKSLGIAIFLAHVGMPLPVASMTFTVQNGLYTTINLPDNIALGYSHFYAEVLRLKRIAVQVKRYPRLVVIFDELFRGTNVQDAYEATVAVTRAFAVCRESSFILSTHITEAAETLQQEECGIQYVYLPAILKDNQPEYTYRLSPGITGDRHGMRIIKQAGILNILREGIK